MFLSAKYYVRFVRLFQQKPNVQRGYGNAIEKTLNANCKACSAERRSTSRSNLERLSKLLQTTVWLKRTVEAAWWLCHFPTHLTILKTSSILVTLEFHAELRWFYGFRTDGSDWSCNWILKFSDSDSNHSTSNLIPKISDGFFRLHLQYLIEIFAYENKIFRSDIRLIEALPSHYNRSVQRLDRRGIQELRFSGN